MGCVAAFYAVYLATYVASFTAKLEHCLAAAL